MKRLNNTKNTDINHFLQPGDIPEYAQGAAPAAEAAMKQTDFDWYSQELPGRLARIRQGVASVVLPLWQGLMRVWSGRQYRQRPHGVSEQILDRTAAAVSSCQMGPYHR